MRFKNPFLRFGSIRAATTPPCNSSDVLYNALDRGNAPSVLDFGEEFYKNSFYRAAIWTGGSMQICLMNIGRNTSTGIKVCNDGDILFYVYAGRGRACIGNQTTEQRSYGVNCGDCIAIPRGVYYNIENTGSAPLRLSVIFAPRQIAYGTVDFTKEGADARDNARGCIE